MSPGNLLEIIPADLLDNWLGYWVLETCMGMGIMFLGSGQYQSRQQWGGVAGALTSLVSNLCTHYSAYCTDRGKQGWWKWYFGVRVWYLKCVCLCVWNLIAAIDASDGMPPCPTLLINLCRCIKQRRRLTAADCFSCCKSYTVSQKSFHL